MTHDQHPHTPRHRLAAALLPCAIALSLAACGGGGSNVRSSPPTTPTTPSGLGFTPNVANDASVMDDKEMLEDLVAAAINDAMRRVEEVTKERMAGFTAGMNLPAGMKLPF